MNNTSVDSYLRDGCGRCEHFQTPACKVLLWTAPLKAMRALLLEAGLVEEMKWGQPCYTLGGKNVVMLASLKDCCALSFLKGAALTDDESLLVSPGPNSRFARYLKFRSLEEFESRREVVQRLVRQAMAIEQSGERLQVAPAAEPVPDELAARLAADAVLREAFERLTPGRRRSHILHIGSAKQSVTREKRVERCAGDILAGRGFNERS